MKVSVVVAEAWRSLTASLSTTLASALTVLIGMFLVGLADRARHLGATRGANSAKEQARRSMSSSAPGQVRARGHHRCRRTRFASAPENDPRVADGRVRLEGSRRFDDHGEEAPELAENRSRAIPCPTPSRSPRSAARTSWRSPTSLDPPAARCRARQLRQEDGEARSCASPASSRCSPCSRS